MKGGKSISFEEDNDKETAEEKEEVRDGTVDDDGGAGSCRHALVVTDGSEQVRASVTLFQCILQVADALCALPLSLSSRASFLVSGT